MWYYATRIQFSAKKNVENICHILYVGDPLLFRRRENQIIKRCVPEVELAKILNKCHGSPYGGHFVGDGTGQKILDEFKTHLFLSPFFMYIYGLKVQFNAKL